MEKIKNIDKTLSSMIKGKDEINFNLFYLLREDEDTKFYTDNKTYIIGQSNKNTPMWIYLNEKPLERKEEIVDIIFNAVKKNNSLSVNGYKSYIDEIVDEVSKKANINYNVFMDMNVYSCTSPKRPKNKGRMIIPNVSHKEIIKTLIKEMVHDSLNQDLSENECDEFALKNIEQKTVYLWEDEKIVSMLRISHKNDKYARLNAVVTKREYRNKGYGGMLVNSVNELLLKENVVPMLYADKEYGPSNTMYRNIGFEKQGEIIEYVFTH